MRSMKYVCSWLHMSTAKTDGAQAKILPVCPEAAARREKKRKATAKASTLNANATNKRLVKAYF